DKGSAQGRVGLGIISDDFKVAGIYVSSNTYRTHPIQIFLEPQISIEDQILLKNYFNFILELFRKELDSEFLTTYKYSNADYTRKYLGLTQVRSLIETFPIINFDEVNKKKLIQTVDQKDLYEIFNILKKKE
ncbi:MAG: SAM-dependent DNA methyltransferase, partial [Promethearchaeota archaeon]